MELLEPMDMGISMVIIHQRITNRILHNKLGEYTVQEITTTLTEIHTLGKHQMNLMSYGWETLTHHGQKIQF